MAEQSDRLGAALRYASLGFSVIGLHGIVGGTCTCGVQECTAPGKHPIGKWKHRQKTRATPIELTELFERHPTANVGLVTGSVSDLVVLDMDDPSLLASVPAVEQIVSSIEGPVCATGREGGGFHIYFRHPDYPTTNTVRRLPGLDGRGEGGYVVAPPSVHHSGKVYHFMEGFGLQRPLPLLPDELRPLFSSQQTETQSPYGEAALKREVEAVRMAPEGQRNATLNQAAFNLGQLVALAELQQSTVEQELGLAAQAAGLTQNETRATIASGLDAGILHPRKRGARRERESDTGSPSDFLPLDMAVLGGTRSHPPQFPVEVFGPRLAEWCRTAANGAGAPVDYVAGALLGVCSALIGNARRVAPRSSWIEPSHLWVMLVGDPSSGKTPGMRPVLDLLLPIERQLERQFRTEMEEYERACEQAKECERLWEKACKDAEKRGESKPEKPAEAQNPHCPALSSFKFNDATRESMALLAAANPKGLLFERDELSGWMNDFSRYGADGSRQDWLMAYNGAHYRIHRVKHPAPVTIDYWSVAVLGGIQPERLVQSIVKEVDDGLGARFLYFWPKPVPPSWPDDITLGPVASNMAARLHSLAMLENEAGDLEPKVIPLSEKARSAFVDWRAVHLHSESHGFLLKGHFGKMPGLVLRVALIIEYMRSAADDAPNQPGSSFGDTVTHVTETSMAAAIRLFEEYFKPMAKRVFNEAETPEGDRDAPMLAKWILEQGCEQFNSSQLRTRTGCPSGLRDAVRMQRACEALRDRGWLRYVGERQDGRPGRKSLEWAVNPLVFEPKAN